MYGTVKFTSHAVWLYHQFNFNHRDIEDLLVERRIAVCYESIRLWCNEFEPEYAQRLLSAQAEVYNLLNSGRQFVSAMKCRMLSICFLGKCSNSLSANLSMSVMYQR